MSNPAPSKLFCSHFIVASPRSYQLVKLVEVDEFAIDTCLKIDRDPNISVSKAISIAERSCRPGLTLFPSRIWSKRRRTLHAQEPPQVYVPVSAKPYSLRVVVGDLASRTNFNSW